MSYLTSWSWWWVGDLELFTTQYSPDRIYLGVSLAVDD